MSDYDPQKDGKTRPHVKRNGADAKEMRRRNKIRKMKSQSRLSKKIG